MANPQKETGYTAIANELLEHIVQTKLNGTQFRVLLFVIRRTYGFQQKTAKMSLSFIANGVGIHRNSVHTTLKQLEAMQIITITHKAATTPQEIAVEKDYQKWITAKSAVHKSVDSAANRSVDSNDTAVPESIDSTVNQSTDSTVNESVDQKRNRKRNIEKNISCACPFFETLWAEYPNKKGKAKVTQKAMREMKRLGYEKLHRALERYRAEKPEWQHWQNGSTFFNGGYLDYLDEPAGKEQTNGTTGTNGTDRTDHTSDDWERLFEKCRI